MTTFVDSALFSQIPFFLDKLLGWILDLCIEKLFFDSNFLWHSSHLLSWITSFLSSGILKLTLSLLSCLISPVTLLTLILIIRNFPVPFNVHFIILIFRAYVNSPFLISSLFTVSMLEVFFGLPARRYFTISIVSPRVVFFLDKV